MSRLPTFCPFCTASHYGNIENPSLGLETEFASPSMTCLSGRVISHNSLGKFSKLLQFLPGNLQQTQEMMNRMGLSVVRFIKKFWAKSFNNGTAYNRVGFQCIQAIISKQYTQLFYKRLTNLEGHWKVCNFRNILPINEPKCLRSKIHVIW